MSGTMKKRCVYIHAAQGKVIKCEICQEDVADRSFGWYRDGNCWIFWVVLSDSTYKKAIQRSKFIYHMTISYLADQNMKKMAEESADNQYYYSGDVAVVDEGVILSWRLENPEISVYDQKGVLVNETH